MAIDLEDIGDDLAIFLDTHCSPEATNEIAREVGFKISSLFGSKKKSIQIKSELAIMMSAVLIATVNEMYREDDAKIIIDEFLSKSRTYVFNDLEKRDKKLSEKYTSRLIEYFDILDGEKPLIDLSFALLCHLGLASRLDLRSQLYLAEFIGSVRISATDLLDAGIKQENSYHEHKQSVQELLEGFAVEVSDWPAHQKKIALEVLLAVLEGEKCEFDRLYPQLTASQFQKVTSYLEGVEKLNFGEDYDRSNDSDFDCIEFDDYHEALDDVVGRLTYILSMICTHEEITSVRIKCELLGYAVTYQAKLLIGAAIPEISWNTFKHSVENRVLSLLDEMPQLNASRTLPDGSVEFIQYTSVFATHLDEIEGIVDQNKNIGKVELPAILSYLSIDQKPENLEAISDLQEELDSSMDLSARVIIPEVQRVFS